MLLCCVIFTISAIPGDLFWCVYHNHSGAFDDDNKIYIKNTREFL